MEGGWSGGSRDTARRCRRRTWRLCGGAMSHGRGFEQGDFERGDFDTAGFEWLDPEIDWRGQRSFPTWPSRASDTRECANTSYPDRGHRGLPDEPEEFIDAGGDQVLVFSREGGRGRGSGAEVVTSRPPTSGRSATARRSACGATGSAPTPSKPPGCRSSCLGRTADLRTKRCLDRVDCVEYRSRGGTSRSDDNCVASGALDSRR